MNRLLQFLVFLIFFSCNQKAIQEEDASQESSRTQKDDTYEVRTIPARQEVLAYPIQSQGKIEARSFVPIIFRTSGILSKIKVQNAAFIKQGQLLAALENRREQIELEDAQVNYRKAYSEFENKLAEYGDSLNYKGNWTRIREKVGLLTGLPNAKVALDRAKFNLELTEFRAPFSGIVEGLELKTGAAVSAMQPIGRILDPSSLEVLSEVLEFDLGKLGIGDSAAIFPLAYPGSKVMARVREINPKVELNGYVKVRLSFSERHNLLEGMSTRVEIYVPESEQVLVPKAAIVKKSGRDVVFTVEESLAKWNYVTLGKENGRQVEVLEGLEPNEEVIISNNLQLAHDSPVKVTSRNPAP